MTRALYIVFDLDGTLIDTREEIAEAIYLTRSEFGLKKVTKQDLNSWFGLHPSNFFEELSNSDALEKAVTAFRVHLLRLHGGHVRLFEDTLPALSRLHELGACLAIATTKPTDLALDLLARSPILEFVQIVQGTDDFSPKPSPELFLRLDSKFLKDPSFTKISVGDRPEDATAARLAGYQAVAIRRNDSGPSEADFKKSGASHVISNLMEVITLAGTN
jgi:phosphoglycolate phosphatase-like HAD superfamily hydrolase